MDKYVIAPPSGSSNNSVGAVDRKWKEGYFEKLPGINEYLAESTGYGIVSGCEPTISGLTVTVGAGVVHLADGTRKEIASTNITLDNADSTNPRIDLVYIDSAGVVAKVTGTAAASPSAPALPSGGVNVAQVSVAAGATTGTITDSRKMLIVSTGINPDQFSGSDSEKLQQAFDLLMNSGGTILIDRKYTLTSNLVIRHSGSPSNQDSSLYVIGVKNGCIEIDGGLIIGSSANRGGVYFQNVFFVGKDKNNDVLFDINGTLFNVFFYSCRFKKFKSLGNAIDGASSIIVNLVFDTCTADDFSDYCLKLYNFVALKFVNCWITSAKGVLNIDGGGGRNLIVRDSIFEHHTESVFKLNSDNTRGIQNAVIEGNYFENNNISIDLTNCTVGATCLGNIIRDNYFWIETVDQWAIVLPSEMSITTSIKNKLLIPITIKNISAGLRTLTEIIKFSATPSNMIPINCDIPFLGQDYLYPYDFKYQILTYTTTGNETAGSWYPVKTWADLLTTVGRNYINEFFFAPRNGKVPFSIFRNSADGDVYISFTYNPGSNQDFSFVFYYG